MSDSALNSALGERLELCEDGIYDWDTEEMDVTGYVASKIYDSYFVSFRFDLNKILTSIKVGIY